MQPACVGDLREPELPELMPATEAPRALRAPSQGNVHWASVLGTRYQAGAGWAKNKSDSASDCFPGKDTATHDPVRCGGHADRRAESALQKTLTWSWGQGSFGVFTPTHLAQVRTLVTAWEEGRVAWTGLCVLPCLAPGCGLTPRHRSVLYLNRRRV